MSSGNGQFIEECYLCSLYREPEKFDDAYVRVEMFQKPANARIFAAILKLKKNNNSINHVSITEELDVSNEFANIGGATYIEEVSIQSLMECTLITTPTPSWISGFAGRIVRSLRPA
jgi:replicative DNA helicase